MKRIVLATLLVASGAAASHRDPAKYDRVLLPFSGSTQGIGGGWFVQWWFRNDGDAPADVFPLGVFCAFCPPNVRYFLFVSIAPHETPAYAAADFFPGPLTPPSPAVSATPPGVLLYVERGKASQLMITGFLGRSTFAAGARRSVSSALRAIPESRFRTGRQSIFFPVASGARYMLRVFALPETVDRDGFTVRTFAFSEAFAGAQNPESLLTTIDARLIAPSSDGLLPGCSGDCDLPPDAIYKPAVAELPLQLPPSLVRVEIEPTSANVRWWAMVSATNPTDEVQLFETSDLP
jgi:hypothetical protein